MEKITLTDNIICNNCTGGWLYKLLGYELNNPFAWCIITPDCMKMLIREYHSLSMANGEITKRKYIPKDGDDEGIVENDVYGIRFETDLEVFYPHYVCDKNFKTPVKINPVTGTKTGADNVYYNDIPSLVADTHKRRNMRYKGEPVFVICQAGGYFAEYSDDDIREIDEIETRATKVIVTTHEINGLKSPHFVCSGNTLECAQMIFDNSMKRGDWITESSDSKAYNGSIKDVQDTKCAIVTMARNENRYVRDWIEYHISMGVSKFLIYDNNDVDGEEFKEVIGDYIENGVAEIVDVRGMAIKRSNMFVPDNLQDICIEKGYKKLSDSGYDWIAVIDMDEYITFSKPMSIQEYLCQDKFRNTYGVKLRWLTMTDNGLVNETDEHVVTRFQSHCDSRYFNSQFKTVYRGGIRKFRSGVHACYNEDIQICNSNGEYTIKNGENLDSMNCACLTYGECYIRHYYTKSTEEFCRYRIINGGFGRLDGFDMVEKYIYDYSQINEMTEEKLKLINNAKKESVRPKKMKNGTLTIRHEGKMGESWHFDKIYEVWRDRSSYEYGTIKYGDGVLKAQSVNDSVCSSFCSEYGSIPLKRLVRILGGNDASMLSKHIFSNVKPIPDGFTLPLEEFVDMCEFVFGYAYKYAYLYREDESSEKMTAIIWILFGTWFGSIKNNYMLN